MPGARGQTECERCGTCCMKGGPALHMADRQLILDNVISRESLITVRKGEPIYLPDRQCPVWAANEFIKLKGKGAEWTCIFYDRPSSTCSIYRHRPRECVLLKCWDTADLQEIAGRDLMDRSAVISQDEPVAGYILEHERQCGLEILGRLNPDRKGKIDKNLLAELDKLVNRDMELRVKALNDLALSLDLELLYFGRPLFTFLTQFSLLPREVNGRITLIQK